MNRTFRQLATLPKAASLLLLLLGTSAQAADEAFSHAAPSLHYQTESSLLAGMSERTQTIVDSAMQNLRVFNQRLARSLDRTDFRMNALSLPSPDNWDYEYWDSVNQTRSFVTPTSDGVMFEFQVKYR